MKIRRGFVTNSSSSSFIALVKKPKSNETFGGYTNAENEKLYQFKQLMEYQQEVYGATIYTISEKEELKEVLSGSPCYDIADILDSYIYENVGEPAWFVPENPEKQFIENLNDKLLDNYLLFVDADRSCTSGIYENMLKEYIKYKNMGEIIYTYCE